MRSASRLVTIHPYFRPHPGKVEAFQGLLERFVAKTTAETGNVFYEFTSNGTEFFCREGYVDAAATLAHLNNVGDILDEALALSELVRLEFHGPAAELDQLREPLSNLKIDWYVLGPGVAR